MTGSAAPELRSAGADRAPVCLSASARRSAYQRQVPDVGRPAALQETTPIAKAFHDLTSNVVAEIVKRNEDLPPTEVVRITTMAGCSPKKVEV